MTFATIRDTTGTLARRPDVSRLASEAVIAPVASSAFHHPSSFSSLTFERHGGNEILFESHGGIR